MTALASQLQDALGPDYRIEHELMGGGMSRLFYATERRHNRAVVVKVLSPELISDETTARFRREIDLTVRLQHPHILPILTSGAWDDVLYYITPFIAGESLRARIEREGKLPLSDIIRILCDVAGALAFAHQRRVVHRDVKPGNILLAEGHAILADFGIARALVTNATPLTGSGVVPGTPAYMAPELLSDETTDLYALGVVGAEMLTGVLPKRSPTAAELVSVRGRVGGDDRRRVRHLADVIARATARDPAERVHTAQDLLGRLNGLDHIRRRRWPVAGALVAAGGVAFVAGTLLRERAPALAPDRYVVLPFGPSTELKRDLTTRMSDALGEWQGIELVDPNATASALQSVQLVQPRDGTKIARRLKAQNVIAFDATSDADSVAVRATLYDAKGDTMLKSRRVAFASAADATMRQMALRRLVNTLVRDGDELPWRSASDHSSPSILAWRSYDAGRAALRAWDLPAAERLLRASVAADAKLSLASLWLAQTTLWEARFEVPADARAIVRRAIDGRPVLGSRDSVMASAALAMTEADFPRACAAYRRLLGADSSDVVGWVGVGDCTARDRRVERTRDGWAFRASYEAAARAYERAGEIGPSGPQSQFRGWWLGRLSMVLYTATNQVRTGEGPDSAAFAAFPSLDHDSLAFVPIPMADVNGGRTAASAESIERAVARSRLLLRSAAEEWVHYAPKSAAAYDSLASWTEVAGGEATVDGQHLSALEIVARALQYTTDSTQRLRLGIASVRLLVKQEDFGRAKSMADSVLVSGAASRDNTMPGLVGLAALTGRVDATIRLLVKAPEFNQVRVAGGRVVNIPKQLAEAIARLTACTAFAAQPDSIVGARRAVVDLIATYFPDSSSAREVRAAVLPTALSFAYPATASALVDEPESPDQLTNAYRLLARGDTMAARAKLVDIRRGLAGRVSGASIDGNFRRARLAVALGDTASALQELDPVLKALPTLSTLLLARVTQTVALVRSLELRARLAARQGDRENARSCARAVVDLWSDADAPLQRSVAEMKVFAKS